MDNKDAYICYNSNDLDWVKRIAEQLESETIDGAKSSRTLNVFFDRWDMGPGDSLIDKMNEGMAKARHVICVLSPEFLAADWPRFEWKHIVASDPNNVGGRIIPILYRDKGADGTTRLNLPAPFRDLKYVDFRKASDFRAGFADLVRKIRNMPPERGRRLPPLAGNGPAMVPRPSQPEMSWHPDSIAEFIFSNLLTVVDMPKQIWTANTPFREDLKKDIWEQVEDSQAFILRSGKLYTFANLNDADESLRKVIDCSTIKADSRNDWFLDPDRERWLVALLNSCLSRSLRKKRIRTDGKGRFYFIPSPGGNDRVWNMPTGKGRTVAKRIRPKGSVSEFWVHHGSRVRFRLLGQKVFLLIVPLYLFTEDGYTAIGGKTAGKLSHMWMGKQQNADIFRDVLFWAYVLGNGAQFGKIETGSAPIQIETAPAAARAQVGVAYDRVDFRTLFNFKDSELEDAASSVKELNNFDEEESDNDEE
ncbi:toll/interleukin-1 receptor domain-containing protein [Luteolibacter pohnpeiensis]|uniref:Toll/interleukin-1 receptor domain-containing protein n=1 Tax=Luteolibacter pohnpeiensis TaxID=454153 RepID=A0A934S7B4_9BACT|nr:toll/interleukin-1 receptor domain-containing protein [Luteolibacter pohnpeiensis]MBK1884410.1 toll/interleukin-1 receptor domain-containing protein [Luteolibacter pohnpeiensis]